MDRVNSYLRHHDQSVNAVGEVIAVSIWEWETERERELYETQEIRWYV